MSLRELPTLGWCVGMSVRSLSWLLVNKCRHSLLGMVEPLDGSVLHEEDGYLRKLEEAN